MFSTLSLALCLAVPTPAQGSVRAPGNNGLVARIELERGRALLVKDSGVVPVRRHLGTHVSPGPGHLELAPFSLAEVHWNGLASLTLVGPTSVSWQQLETGELLWRFSALHDVEIEIRSRGARIELPDAWRVELHRGAYALHGLPGGGVELEHRAGESLRASWIGGEGLVPPPILLAPGQRADLQGAPRIESTTDQTATTPRWAASAWPWGRGGIPDVPDLTGATSDPWNAGAWPWGPDPATLAPWERWDWPWTEPAPGGGPKPGADPSRRAGNASEPESGAPAAPGSPPPPSGDDPKGEPLPVAATPGLESGALLSNGPPAARTSSPGLGHPGPGDALASFWRDLAAERIERHPGYALERSESWIRDELPSGRLRIQLDARAVQPRWCFGRNLDLRLFPGAAVVLEKDGLLVRHEGWVRILVATEGRDWTTHFGL